MITFMRASLKFIKWFMTYFAKQRHTHTHTHTAKNMIALLHSGAGDEADL